MGINVTPGSGRIVISGGNASTSPVVFDGIQAPPNVSTLTWFNQRFLLEGTQPTASNDSSGRLVVHNEVGYNGNNRSVLGVAAPSAPWTFDVGFTWSWHVVASSGTYPLFGVCAYDQSSGKLIKWFIFFDGSTAYARFSQMIYNNGGSQTAYTTSAIPPEMSTITLFLRLVNDGTNYSAYWSNNNVNWTQFGSAHSVTEFLSGPPTHVGLVTDVPSNYIDTSLTAKVFHWKLY